MKMKYLNYVLCAAVCAVTTMSCGDSIPTYLDEEAPIEERVEDALSRMTLDEKIDMIHAQSKFSSKGVPRLGIPENWLSDGPFGVREENLWSKWGKAGWTNDACTALPTLTALAATWNPDLSLLYGTVLGEEARYRNKNVILGPGVNIFRTPLNGRNFEYMGEDPYLASIMVVPYIKGVQKSKVAACVKHFALNNQEANRSKINVVVDDRALHEIYLPAFKTAVKEGGVWSVMGAYNRYRGQFCCHNEYLLNDILKGEWEFDGVVISDWGGTEETMQAVTNGLDLEFGTGTDGMTVDSGDPYDSYFLADPYKKLIQDGVVGTEELDDKVRRVLRLVFRTTMAKDRPYGSFVSEEHFRACRDIAQEGVVLLKNEDSLLPVAKGDHKRILVVGDNAARTLSNAGGSSMLKPKYESLTLDSIKEFVDGASEVTYLRGYQAYMPGYEPDDTERLRQEAVEAAKEADLVIYVGGMNRWAYQDCEGRDRQNYELPFQQDALIDELLDANPQTILVLHGGTAFSMPWREKAKAIIYAMYGGSENGHVLSDVIFGEVNPSGKLPFTIAESLTDYPPHALGTYDPTNKGDVNYDEGIFVGYRWFDENGIDVPYPFGYGLSYTDFEVGKAKLSSKRIRPGRSLKIRVPVTNSGNRRGAEVVQLYVKDVQSSLPRPEKELKAFQKVWLEPGETKYVEMLLTEEAFMFYDPEKQDWVAEKGEFELMIGTSSRDICETIRLDLISRGEKRPSCIKVMSYNIRYDNPNDGENCWENRKEATLKMIDELRPDVFGVQEALAHQVRYIEENSPEYASVGVGRDDGKEAGEFMSIFYDRSKIRLDDWGTIWLSQTPEKPSLGWDAWCPRTATWAEMEIIETGQKFFYVNTHLDHGGRNSRRNALDLIIATIKEKNQKGCPTILTGDFNVSPDNDFTLESLRTFMYNAAETASHADTVATSNAFGKREGKHIDYIWWKGFRTCKEYRVVRKEYSGIKYVSDHWPIISQLEL